MFLTDEQYTNVTELLDNAQKPPFLAELSAWSEEKYGLKVYGYFCDMSAVGKRLLIVLWDMASLSEVSESNGLNFSAQAQSDFREEFASLSAKYGLHADYAAKKDLLVAFETVADEIQKRELAKIKEEIYTLNKGDVKRILIDFSVVHFFYETDRQITLHETDGVSESLERECSEILRKYDKFGVFNGKVKCKFSSVQTLNEKYRGNMFYYTR